MYRESVLLINPHIEDFSAYDHYSKPLGLLFLAAYLQDRYNVHFINALTRTHPSIKKINIKPDGRSPFFNKIIDKPNILADIPRNFKRYGLEDSDFILELKKYVNCNPKYIFITSGMTYWYTGLRHTINLVRNVFPDSKIILGGVYASLLAEHAKSNLDIDYIVPFQNLWKVLENLENITGKKFSKNIKVPAYELLNEYYYAPILTSTGCVFDCSYCAGNKLNSFYQFPADFVADIIIELFYKYKVKNFAFYDDALLVNSSNHINLILKKIINAGVKASFYTPNGLHIKFMTKNTSELMKAAGFKDLRMSLESNDFLFQQNTSPKVDNREFEYMIDILLRTGFQKKQINVYTLMNVPNQKTDTIEKTMIYINDLGAMPKLAFYSPIPGTVDYDNAMKVTDVSEPLFQNNTVYLYRSGFDIDYYQKLKNIEYESKIYNLD